MKHRQFLLFLLVLVVACVSTFTAWVHEMPVFLPILFVFAMPCLIYKENARKIYLLSFAANIIFGCIMIYVFQQNGTFFDTGGDDAKFYSYFNLANQGNDVLFQIRYGNFIRAGSTYILLLQDLGVENISPLLVYPLNWFYGANVCALAYILGTQLGLTKKQAFGSALLLAIYPFFILSETKMLREIFAALFLILFMVTYHSQIKAIFKVILIAFIMFICFRVRSEYILFMFIFIFIDVFYKLYFAGRKNYAYFLLFMGLLIGVGIYTTIIQFTGREQGIDDISQSYANLRSTNIDSSLGAKLKGAGVIFTPIILLYLWISPFPPPAFQVFNAVYVIITLGVIFWYHSFLRFPIITYNYLMKYDENIVLKKNVIKILTFLLVCSVITALTSADVRHISPFYPFLFIIYTLMLKEYPVQRMKMLNYTAGVGTVILFMIYLTIKTS